MRAATVFTLASFAMLTGAGTIACNGLLGNVEHDVGVDAGAVTNDVDGGDPSAPLDATTGATLDSTTGAATPDGSTPVDAQDASKGPCSVGETSTVACGNCGRNVRTCSAAGAWVDGPCTGAGACAPNATLTCNTSGTQTCTDSCTWGPCSCSGGGCVPSCATAGAGKSDCGSSGNVNCCTTITVSAGSYLRGYDGIALTDKSFPATVTSLRLDKYEVTVGRFRPFVAAMAAGYMPAAGAGKHTHLNLGQGLNATGGGHEPGWGASWNGNLATTTSAWDSKLSVGTWTPAPGSNERLPITGISWYDAYAFCIWDGGFLPSDAEWNYVATGGNEQRSYPWSAAFPPGANAVSCGNAWYSGCSSATTPAGTPIPVGGLSPGGDGKWGHADMAGNVSEWALDWGVTYVNPCNDCVNLTPVTNTGKSNRGGDVTSTSFQVLAGVRGAAYVAGSFATIGVRCARAM